MGLPADRARDLHGGAQPLAQRLWIGVGRGPELLLEFVVFGVGAEALELSQYRRSPLIAEALLGAQRFAPGFHVLRCGGRLRSLRRR